MGKVLCGREPAAALERMLVCPGCHFFSHPAAGTVFSFPLFCLSFLMFLYLSGNNFHHYVPSAMQPTNKSSHMWACLNILCAKTPHTYLWEQKPLITMLQGILGEVPLTFTKWRCSTFFQRTQNSLNHEMRGFKISSLAPSLSLNRETNCFFQALAIPHITQTLLIFEVICSVWLSMLLHK